MIKKLLNISVAAAGMTAAFASSASASLKVEDLYTTTSIVHIISLLCALICLIWAMKILSYVRGGSMSKSWQMFVLGFGFLVIAQILALSKNTGLMILPEYFSAVIYLLMAMTWLVGLYQTRRVLG